MLGRHHNGKNININVMYFFNIILIRIIIYLFKVGLAAVCERTKEREILVEQTCFDIHSVYPFLLTQRSHIKSNSSLVYIDQIRLHLSRMKRY